MSRNARSWRGKGHESDLQLTAEQNEAVGVAYERAVRRRRELDVAMQRARADVAQFSSELRGLQHSLKSLESFRGKVARRESFRTAEESANGTADLNRYTLTFPPEQYADGVLRSYDSLREQGFVVVNERNSWSQPDYRGINTTWAVAGPDGKALHKFEVQFHTPESFSVKDGPNHLLYELQRADDRADPPLTRNEAIRHLQAERYGEMEAPPGHERVCPPAPARPLSPVTEAAKEEVRAEERDLAERKAAEKVRAEADRNPLGRSESGPEPRSDGDQEREDVRKVEDEPDIEVEPRRESELAPTVQQHEVEAGIGIASESESGASVRGEVDNEADDQADRDQQPDTDRDPEADLGTRPPVTGVPLDADREADGRVEGETHQEAATERQPAVSQGGAESDVETAARSGNGSETDAWARNEAEDTAESRAGQDSGIDRRAEGGADQGTQADPESAAEARDEPGASAGTQPDAQGEIDAQGKDPAQGKAEGPGSGPAERDAYEEQARADDARVAAAMRADQGGGDYDDDFYGRSGTAEMERD